MKRNIRIGLVASLLLIALWHVSALWKSVMVHTAQDTVFEISKDTLLSAYTSAPFPSREEATATIAKALTAYKGPALKDEWGTTYRVEIHAWSPTGGLALIRSAGRDRQYDTADDKIITVETQERPESVEE